MGKTKSEIEGEIHALRARLVELTETVSHNDGALGRTLGLGLSILQRTSLSDLLGFLSRDFGRHYPADRAALRFVDPGGEIAHLLRVCGSSPSSFPDLLVPGVAELGYDWPTRDAPEAAAHDSGRTFAWSDPSAQWPTTLEPFSASRHGRLFPDYDIKLASVAIMPLLSGDMLVGLLAVGSRDQRRYAPGLATDFLRLLAALITVAIQNQINAARLQMEGLTDPLTGLFNRRYLDARLREEIRRVRDDAAAVGCLVIDADYFKRINDAFGHLGGDCVLKEIATRIRSHVKSRDIIARIGGEEFVVVAGGVSREDSRTLAERIRAAIESAPVPIESQESRVTVSIGLCWASYKHLHRDDASTASFLISQADTALYAAKNAGRNCVRTIDLSEREERGVTQP